MNKNNELIYLLIERGDSDVKIAEMVECEIDIVEKVRIVVERKKSSAKTIKWPRPLKPKLVDDHMISSFARMGVAGY